MRARALAWLGALLVAVAAPVAATPGACATEGPHAALVIDRGEEGGVDSYCVALPSGGVSGIDLIELAADQFGVTYRLGYGGGAVCMLNGTGPAEGDCFGDHPYFWGYWRGDGSGGWQWSSSGAASTTVEDGDVEGWSWGAGNGPSSHPPPPSTTFASVCGDLTRSRPSNSGQDRDPGAQEKPRSKNGSSGAGASASLPVDVTSDEGVESDREPKAKGSGPGKVRREGGRQGVGAESASGDAVPEPSAPALAVPASRDRAGPPPAGIAGVAVAVGLAAGGAFLARRQGRRA